MILVFIVLCVYSQVEFLDACAGCPFVIQMWSHVVGLYDYTLLLEYCPYGSLDKLLEIVSLMLFDWLGVEALVVEAF